MTAENGSKNAVVCRTIYQIIVESSGSILCKELVERVVDRISVSEAFAAITVWEMIDERKLERSSDSLISLSLSYSS